MPVPRVPHQLYDCRDSLLTSEGRLEQALRAATDRSLHQPWIDAINRALKDVCLARTQVNNIIQALIQAQYLPTPTEG